MTLFAALLCAQVALSPRPLESFTSHLPARSVDSVTTLIGDFDRDSDPDLLALANGHAPELLINDGHGLFRRSPRPQPFTAAPWRGGAVADFDNDGDLDLVLVADAAPALVFLNQGNATFVPGPALPALPLPATAVTVGDVNRDGLPDVFISVLGAQDQLYLNTGGGSFQDVSATHLPQARTFSNGATLLQLAAASPPALVRGFANNLPPELLLNNGLGRFTAANQAFATPLSAGRIAARDVDGDQRPDVVVEDLRRVTPTSPPILVFLNSGASTFPQQGRANAPAGATSGFALTDLNGDTLPDLVVNYAAGGQVLLLNAGNQLVAQPTQEALSYPKPFADVVTLDADLDGDQDLLLPGLGAPSRLLLNRGAARFLDVTGASFPVQHFGCIALAQGDIDGDGSVDVVAGIANENPRAYLNDGAGHFTDATGQRLPLPATGDLFSAVLLADLDQDRKPDLLTTSTVSTATTGRLRILINDGQRFHERTGGWLPNAVTAPIRDAAVGLATLDAFPDLVVAVQNGPLLFLRNTGTALVPTAGAFAPNPAEPHAAVLLTEATGDNFLDVVVVNYLVPGRVYSGNGLGGFAEVPLALAGFSDRTTCAAVGDLNRDLLPDLVLGVEAGPTRVFLGTGGGRFQDATGAWLPGLQGTVSAVALADINGDQRLDLLVARRNEPNLLFLQTAAGGFANTPLLFEGDLAADSRALLAFDVDDDRDTDVLVGNHGAPARLSFGTAHQLSFDGLSLAGRPVALNVIGDPLGIAILFFAPGPVATPRIELAPYGVWKLGAFPLQFTALGLPATRQVPLRLGLPPSLAGAELHWQAVFIDPTFTDILLGNQEIQRVLGL